MNVLNCISNASELKYMHAHTCSRAHTHTPTYTDTHTSSIQN